MSARVALLGLLAALGAAAPALADEGTRTPLARVELEGPLEAVDLSFPDGNGTTIALPLAAGERRTLTLPLPAPAIAAQALPVVTVQGAGAARFAGWVGSDVERLSAEWGRLPLGLRRRPRPPAPERAHTSGPPLAALLVACAGFLGALRWRRRGPLALAVGALAAAAAYALALPPPATGRELRLLEGDGSSGAWLALRVARERLELAPAAALLVETRPPLAPLRVRVEPGPQGPRWILLAPGATIDLLDLAPLEPDLLTRAGTNRLGALTQVWVREADGRWSRRGSWPAGAPLPAALAGPGEPPGWLNPALPMGTGVLLGRRASDPAEAPSGAPAPDALWVRLVGF